MTDSEREFAIKHLIEGRDALLAAIAGLSESQMRLKPQPERWSIAECVEHVAVTEELLFGMVTRGTVNPNGKPLDPEKDARLAVALLNRERRFSAPETVRATGRFATVDESIAHFLKSRERVIAYARECAEDLRHRFTLHPLLGEIDCYRCLLLLALHPARHAAQINEIAKV
jgi:hypothetical protein